MSDPPTAAPTTPRPPASALPLRAMRVVVASLAIGLLPTFLVGALSVPISDDLEVGTATIGAAVSAFFLAAALSSVPAGRQVDHRGAAFGYRTGLTGVGLTAGVIGLVASAGWHLVVAFAFAGASLAFVDPSITRTITGSVGWRRQGIAFGVKEAAVPSASMVAGVTLPLLGETVGWQVPFLVVAALALGLAALVPSSIEAGGAERSVRARRRPPAATAGGTSQTALPSPGQGEDRHDGHGREKHADEAPAPQGIGQPGDQRRTDRSRGQQHPDGHGGDGHTAGDGVDGHVTERGVGPCSDERAVPAHTAERTVPAHTAGRTADERDDRHGQESDHPDGGGTAVRRLALLALGSGLGGGAGAAVATFIVPTGIVLGVGATAAGLILSVASLGSIGVRLGAGWFVDRRPRAVLDLLVALLAAGLVGGVALAVAAHLGAPPVEVDALAGAVEVAGATDPAATGVVILLVTGALLMLGPGWGWTGLVFLTATRLTPERPAQASGAILAGLGGGGALFPLGAGWLAESIGFGWTWTIVAAAMALSVLLMMTVRATRR